MTYTLYNWIFFFFIYCFLGWCIESTIVSVNTRKLTNRGFLRGPALPIYGFGAILILFCTLPFEGNVFMQYIVGVVACTVLEYVTAVLMEAVFKTKYWDYSGKFLNFQGRICLVSSLFWGVLTLFVIKVIHAPIAEFTLKHIPVAVIIAVDAVLSAVFVTDTYFSAKAAFMLTKIARALEEANLQLELAKMQARDKLSIKAEEFTRRLNDVTDSFRDADEDLRRIIAEVRRSRKDVFKNVGFTVRNMVRSNPSSRHKKFAAGYAQLKEYVSELKNNR